MRNIKWTDCHWVVQNLGAACHTRSTNLDSNNAGLLLHMPLGMPILIYCLSCHHLRVWIILQSILKGKPCNVHVVSMMRDDLRKMVKGSDRMSRLHLQSPHACIALHTHCYIVYALRNGELVRLNQCGCLQMQIISGLNHITFWCHRLILISGRWVPIIEPSAFHTNVNENL
jgi:hypothetical protein